MLFFCFFGALFNGVLNNERTQISADTTTSYALEIDEFPSPNGGESI
jgi:hypothetical protein